MSIFSKIFNRKSDEFSERLTTIHRTQIIDGFSVPAFIHNYHYYFTDLQVYSDGLVWCWEMVDLPLFKEKLDKGWIVTSVPDDGSIGITNFGHWKIKNGKWKHDNKSFYDYVFALVKNLNPRLENLYDCHGRTSDKVGNTEYSIFSTPKQQTYYLTGENKILQHKRLGESIPLFYRAEDKNLYLARLSVFEDGRIQITDIPEKNSFVIGDLEKLIAQKQLLSEAPPNERINIYNFGSFEIAEGESVNIKDKYKEILDIYGKLQGKDGALETCRKTLEQYKQNPSAEVKAKLKTDYENIPPHLRIFIGDMDTKDFEVKRIIYSEIQKFDQ